VRLTGVPVGLGFGRGDGSSEPNVADHGAPVTAHDRRQSDPNTRRRQAGAWPLAAQRVESRAKACTRSGAEHPERLRLRARHSITSRVAVDSTDRSLSTISGS
jgi:hypothetical protein